MLSNNATEFTKENIDLYFKELSKEYKRLGGRNMPVEIVLIGGAAIVESYGFRNMTTDIDAIIPAMGIMKDAINHIGDKFHLPNSWLNADFMQTSSYSPKLFNYSKPYKTFNQVLNVRIISGEYLIAMKLKSSRQYKNDLSDIVGILNEHKKQNNPICLKMISKAVENLYGSWDKIDKNAISFIKTALEIGEFEELYSAIRKNEQKNKATLISWEKKSPGHLNEGNINSIIQYATNKNENKTTIEENLKNLINQHNLSEQHSETNFDER